MVTIDLTTPPAPPASFLDGMARRLALTLPELRLVAELAGGAPLPFDLATTDAPGAGSLSGRLGQSRGSVEDSAYSDALGTLHDPHDTLRRRGLLTDEGADPGIVGAVGLLATPRLALDIDVAAGAMQVKAWHRHSGGAVASLSTCDGIVFELAWFPADQWTVELARVTAVPEDLPLSTSHVPAHLDVPYALADAVGEALHSGRSDLVPVLIGQADGAVHADGDPLGDAEAAAAVSAVHSESRGRLRILAAEVGERATTAVGVVSWVLLRDGWHSLTPRHDDGARVAVARVDPDHLATELAPVLAQVATS
ncbi:putative LigA [metagenome]|uniref:Putative LigA n=1 Tax=metagenome TaxID=256318 RepID=A0A2P2CJG0_9ZZZZ